MADKGLPVITLDRELDHPNVKAMIVNNYEGERQLIQKLVDEEYKSFAFLSGQNTADNKERYNAFRDVLKTNKISFNRSVINNPYFPYVYSLVAEQKAQQAETSSQGEDEP